MKSNVNQVRVNYERDLITSENFDWDEIKKFTRSRFPLHTLAVSQNFKKLIEIFMTKKVTKLQMNEKDEQGNTVLLLTSKLCRQDAQYLKLVNFLIKQGANPKLKDKDGWSVLDEAIMTQNVNLLTLVFDGMNNYKKMNWPKNQVKIQTKLKKAPDFYVEMHWECNSAVIPFL